jgi:O-antigen ligase/Flp pilus assembly protein TadD
MINAVVRACDRTIFTGITVLVLLIPVAVWFPCYNLLTIKMTLLQCGAAVLIAAWAIRSLERGHINQAKPPGRFIAPAFAFALSALFSYFFVTSSRDTSFEELSKRIPYFLIFLVTALSFSNFTQIRRTFVALMTSALLVSMYGMLQHFQLDPFHLGDATRIQSTFGNPNFYVGFLTLAIPAIASAFDISDPGVRKKILPLLALILVLGLAYYVCYLRAVPLAYRAVIFCVFLGTVIILCAVWRLREQSAAAITLFLLVNNMLLTGSRSALIGLGSAFIVFLSLSFIFVFKAISLKKLLSLSAASLVLAGMVTAGVIYISHSDEDRLNVVSERTYYIKGAVELFREKPIFGHGLGTFKINYPVVKSTASWAFNATCFEFVSNVYNEHLEILHDEGIAGVLVWSWLLFAIIALSIMAIRAYSMRQRPPPQAAGGAREPPEVRFYAPSPEVLLIGLLSGVIAILTGNIFSLSMRYTATGFMFWLFLGFIASLSSAALRQPSPVEGSIAKHDSPNSLLRKSSVPLRAVQVLLIAFAGVTILISCRFFLSDVYLNEAVAYSRDAYSPVDTSSQVFHDIFIEGTSYRSRPELWERAIVYYRKTVSLNPYCLPARYFFGNAFNRRWNMTPLCNPGWGDRDGILRTDADRALEQYGYLTKQAPHSFEVDYELGDLYGKLGDLDKSIACYNDYKRYKPFFTKIHHALAGVYCAKKDWADAAEALKDALDLNQRFTRGYCELSAVYRKMGKNDLAAEMFAKAREISPKKADLAMSDVWRSMGETDEAVQSCRAALARDSTDTAALFSLGWLYIQKREWQNAIAVHEWLVRLDTANTLGFVNLSNLYYETGKTDAAREALRKAYALDPGLVDAYVKNQAGKGGP